jgi:hypothetical protein
MEKAERCLLLRGLPLSPHPFLLFALLWQEHLEYVIINDNKICNTKEMQIFFTSVPVQCVCIYRYWCISTSIHVIYVDRDRYVFMEYIL